MFVWRYALFFNHCFSYSAKSYIEIKNTLDIYFFSIYATKKRIFITGPRSPEPRSPSKKIDLGRGVPGRNGFGPRSPGTVTWTPPINNKEIF